MLGRERSAAYGRLLAPPDDALPGGGATVAWVVSPHLLVAQAVAAALGSVGVLVEVHAWDTVVLEALAERSEAEIRHVVVVHHELDVPDLVDHVARLVRVGHLRVAVVTGDPVATPWGVLLDDPAVDVVMNAQSLSELAEAVRRFASGARLLAPEQRQALRADWARALDSRQHVVALLHTLSPQQRRVLDLLASGHRVKEVAHIMGVADGTARSHVRALRAKLGAGSQIEAVAMLRQVDEGAAPRVPGPRTASADDQRSVSPR